MKNKNSFQLRPNFFTIYILGIVLFFVCALSGYKIWNRYSPAYNIEESEFQGPVLPSSMSLENSALKAEEELLDSNSLHPEFVINDGDNLGSILDEAKISSNEAAEIITAFSKKINPRKLTIGTAIKFNFEEVDSAHRLLDMVVIINNTKKIEVSRDGNKFYAREIVVPLIHKVDKRIGTIKNSFIATALELSVPANAIIGMVRAFSYDVDFQRDIKRGDKLEVVMDKFYTEDGKISRSGDVLYSSLILNGKKVSIYYFTSADGQAGYYNEKGENIKKEFLRTPVNAARISSKFGVRQHPVHGYSRMHRGVDFAAPAGTPILAAGGGVIEVVNNYYGNYGKYIRIKHNSTYSTVYAHASRFSKGIKPGMKVNQGQVIAYVGSTGATTGPHLHYEVIEHGKQINPLKFKFASSGGRLVGRDLELFQQNKKKIAKHLAG